MSDLGVADLLLDFLFVLLADLDLFNFLTFPLGFLDFFVATETDLLA